jgi:hypothetical protein
MAYPECPECRTPQLVPDEAAGYQCFTCYAQVGFARCPECGYQQSVSKRWTAFTCGHCERRVEAPRNVPTPEAVQARRVLGVGYPYPKL